MAYGRRQRARGDAGFDAGKRHRLRAATSRAPRILASILKPRLTGCDKASTADVGLDKNLGLTRRQGKCHGYRLRAVLTGDFASAADLDFDLKPGLTGCAAASASDIDFEPF